MNRQPMNLSGRAHSCGEMSACRGDGTLGDHVTCQAAAAAAGERARGSAVSPGPAVDRPDASQWLASMRDVLASLPTAVAYLAGRDHVFEFINDRYRQLVGDR